ncbi:hypothetical protein SARC_09955 [Sphaeroforma arctica JP610]|uniref:Plasma membrane ATPase n=1 Tax=Sphaeroforma arctica JP610 TaxID=667725 RepID=A0A0L0FNN8_9EUKA|nr:hypothetical protein SARC_09955 [Sphaeroforma arctica JP610]KNC77588.1 hypothetical protein SARC_09955 [Sphaeroforma arctica JP610]|eukprot:XP_014151490.1 hypothetical protein SARC_09955 [Sphaeroforma arctica JP610]
MGGDKDSRLVKGEVGNEISVDVESHGLTTTEAQALLAQFGRNELQEKTVPKWMVFLQQLYQPMPIMIWIAIVIEAAIQNWLDMAVLLAIQFINATIGWYEITKAGDAVAALKASLKPSATVKRDDKWQNIDAAECVPGDLCLLGAGSAIPADCRINEGRLEVDQSALTGESLPVTMNAGDEPKMGSTATRGEVEATVIATGMNTFFGKTAAMLNQGNEMGNLQRILLRIMMVLVTLSITLCISAMIFLLANGEDFKQSISFAVVLLVASIPIAIEIVTTATLAIGSRSLAEHGAIVTNLSAIEEMAGMNILCSDKTGTLTLNKMVIQDDCPTFSDAENQYTVLQKAALAAKWKEPPRDALDTLVLGAVDLTPLDEYEQIDFMPFDPSIKRTEGTLKDSQGRVFKTTKGAPQIIAGLLSDTPENQTIKKQVAEIVHGLGTRGIRSLAVSYSGFDEAEGQDTWTMAGILTFLDPPRPDTKETIEKALELGVDVKMITGDHAVIAKETCRMLGMGTNIQGTDGIPELDEDGKPAVDCGAILGDRILEADGFAEVFPEHKFTLVEAFRQQGFATGMTGDGVNDAPALKRADVGIAVAGATDAARAAADIVLTGEGLSVLVHAIITAREIFKRIQAFINYRIAATLQLLFFFFISVFAFRPEEYAPVPNDSGEEWPFFFQLPVLLLMIITVLNDGTLITIGYDFSIANKRPDKWNLKVLWLVSIILGAVACLSSLILLWCALDSHSTSGVFHAFGLPGMDYGQIVTMIYLKVSVSDFLTLFSSRTYPGFFWTQRPGLMLLMGAGISLTISTLIACLLPKGELDEVPIEGLARGDYQLWALWTWIYCIFWWFIQDGCKVLCYSVVYKYDLFGAISGQAVNLRAANTVNDREHPAARQSVAMVENKVFLRKLDVALSVIETATGEDEVLKRSLSGMVAEIEEMRRDLAVQQAHVAKKSQPGTARSSVAARAESILAHEGQSARQSVGSKNVSARSSFAPRSSIAFFNLEKKHVESIATIRTELEEVENQEIVAAVESALLEVEKAAVLVQDVVDTAFHKP